MGIHVQIGYKDGGKPFVTVLDKRFERAGAAVRWWQMTGFNTGDNCVTEVLRAAKDEYVGTEHEIMTPGSSSGIGEAGYTNMWCCIEGQEGKDTFDARLKDLVVERIIDMGGGLFQLEGKDLDDRKVWQSVRLTEGKVVFRRSSIADQASDD